MILSASVSAILLLTAWIGREHLPSLASRCWRWLVVGNGTKAVLERSGVRVFLSALITVVAYAWADGREVVAAVKEEARVLVPALLVALGLTGSKSGKVK